MALYKTINYSNDSGISSYRNLFQGTPVLWGTVDSIELISAKKLSANKSQVVLRIVDVTPVIEAVLKKIFNLKYLIIHH